MPSNPAGGPSPSPFFVPPLSTSGQLALLKCLENFGDALTNVTDSGHLIHECHTFDNAVGVGFQVFAIFPYLIHVSNIILGLAYCQRV